MDGYRDAALMAVELVVPGGILGGSSVVCLSLGRFVALGEER